MGLFFLLSVTHDSIVRVPRETTNKINIRSAMGGFVSFEGMGVFPTSNILFGGENFGYGGGSSGTIYSNVAARFASIFPLVGL